MTECRGLCKGTERSALESPARYASRRGQRPIPVCICCNSPMRPGSPGDFSAAIAEGRIAQGVKPTEASLWVDDACGFDVVSMKGLVPA